MVPWSRWSSLVAWTASALACLCLNVVYFCSKRNSNETIKPTNAAGRSKLRGQGRVEQEAEKEALLPDSAASSRANSDAASTADKESVRGAISQSPYGVVPDKAVVDSQGSKRNAQALSPSLLSAASLKIGDASSEMGLPHKKARTTGDGHALDGEPVSSQQVAIAGQLDTDFLQELIDSELGPPKFAVAKAPPIPAHKPATHSRTPKSLEALLDVEFGPPKFAVRKSTIESGDDEGPEPLPTNGQSVAAQVQTQPQHQASPAPPAATHHLRLEVLTGPSSGMIFDTANHAHEVRIGRLPDCSLALSEDQEVSSKHATIHFSVTDNCWKMVDVGSLNGSSLNGMTLSTNRQPSPPAPLVSGDILELGSVTRVMVTCTPSTPRPTSAANHQPTSTASAAAAAAAVHAPLRLHGSDNGMLTGTALNGSGMVVVHPNGPGVTVASSPNSRRNLSGLTTHGMASAVGPPLAVKHHEGLGISLAVQQRLGADHKRTNTGCEDVAHWELPWSSHGDASASSTSSSCQGALLAIFDGHQGVKAASKAKEVLPALLRDQLKAHDLSPDGPPGRLLHGRSAADQVNLLTRLFLETDTAISLDEGCTATVVLFERDEHGDCVLQSANVGDSSAVLVQLPAAFSSPTHTSTSSSQPSISNHHTPDATATTDAPLLLHSATWRAPSSSSSQASGHARGADADAPAGSVPPAALVSTELPSNSSSSGLLSSPSTQPSFSDVSASAVAATTVPAAGFVPGTAGGFRMAGPQPPPPTASPQLPSVQESAGGSDSSTSAPSPELPPGVTEFIPPGGMEGGALEGGGHWIKLSEDHRISSSVKERDRLAALGHKAVRTRLYGLNISRMLGDKFLKDEQLGFIAEPHVSHRVHVAIAPATVALWDKAGAAGFDRDQQSSAAAATEGNGAVIGRGGRAFLMLASDGLWDVVGEGRAAALLSRTLAQDPETSVAELAGLLLSQALTLRSKDDITVMVAELHALKTTTTAL